MTRVLLVDDEPLVLIGMQGMLNWAALGYEVVGTARNGAEALRAVQEKQPDIVVSDIRMPVMDGFALAEACHKDGSALPAFIMLTSYEEFDYVKRSMRLGVVDYLVKIDLTADSLTAALEHARATAEKEKKLRMPSPAPVSLDTFRDRLFLQLYGGLFTDRAVFDRQCAELGVTFKAPRHIVAVGSLQTPDLPTSQLVTLSTGVTRMAAETLPKYRPCRVTAMDLRHFSVLLPLEADEDPEAVLAPILKTAGQILYNYFSTAIYWAVGRPVNDILKISESQHDAFAALPLLHEGEPVAFYHESPNTQLDHRAQVVGQVQQYIRDHLSERLTLNDVAAVFNFSPNYLSQLFAQNSESGFVEFVTATRITAAKELMASTDLKVYEISDKVGFDSAFYFSKVFKKLEGVSPREISESQHDAFAALPLLHEGEPVAFYHESPNTQLDHRAQVVGQVQQYIRDHLSERLTLNDVAAVFNFSPNYLSQLFAQNSESGFVEFVTATRITAAKELMASTDLKVYEISDKVGFDSAFYFSKVFKKLEGVSPREYMQRMKVSYVDAKDEATV